MKTFRYDLTKKWFKGNTHLHSTASDGGKTFMELAELYHSAGYDFLFRTDHWVASDVASDPLHYPLLWIDGVELDEVDSRGTLFHVVCLGAIKGLLRKNGMEAGIRLAREQGALIILAHPHWSGNSLDDCARWPFDGVEIYNHVCHWLNGKSNGLIHWDAAMMKHPDVLAIAADDTHLRPEHPGWNGGWIMVNAETCSEAAIIKAIRCGNYYSSCGPEIRSLEFDGTTLHVTTSPIRFARLVGPCHEGDRRGTFEAGTLLTHCTFSLPTDRQYVYLEIEDDQGRRAWTNNLFTNLPGGKSNSRQP